MNNINPKIEDLFDNLKIGGSEPPKRGRPKEIDDELKKYRHDSKYQRLAEEERLAEETLAEERRAAGVVVYIFSHPALTRNTKEYYYRQLRDCNPREIKEIVYVQSIEPTSEHFTDLTVDKAVTVETEATLLRIGDVATATPGFSYLKNFSYFKKDLYYNYEEFEDQSFKIYEFPESLNGIPIKIITYDNSIKVFRTSGIGCKRFLSQIYHNLYHHGSTYCGIDHLNLLYRINYIQRITKVGNRQNSNIIYYSHVIKEYLTKYIEYDFYGFRKSTDAGHTEPIISSSKIYKFIFISPKILSAYCYDPFCTDFKEDVDFIYRIEKDTSLKFCKNNNFVVCKIEEILHDGGPIIRTVTKEDGKEYCQLVKQEIIARSTPLPENFISYTYWYQRLLYKSEKLKIKFIAGYTNNEILIYPIPMVNFGILSSLGLFSNFDKGIIEPHVNFSNVRSDQIFIKFDKELPFDIINAKNEYTCYNIPFLLFNNISDLSDTSGCNLKSYNTKMHELNKKLAETFGYKLDLKFEKSGHKVTILNVNAETKKFIKENNLKIKLGIGRTSTLIYLIPLLPPESGSSTYDIEYSK